MGKEYRAKSFKSGNSVAIRMPAALGIEPDREWTIVEKDGEFLVRAVSEQRRKFNIDKVAGSATSLKPIKPEDRLLQARPLRWDLLDGGSEA
jgi:antitoxin VapB